MKTCVIANRYWMRLQNAVSVTNAITLTSNPEPLTRLGFLMSVASSGCY